MEGTTRSNLSNFVQCVDDMSASLINATTFAEERISLHSADVVAPAVVVRLSGRSRQTQRPDSKELWSQVGLQADGGLSKISWKSGLGRQGP